MQTEAAQSKTLPAFFAVIRSGPPLESVNVEAWRPPTQIKHSGRRTDDASARRLQTRALLLRRLSASTGTLNLPWTRRWTTLFQQTNWRPSNDCLGLI